MSLTNIFVVNWYKDIDSPLDSQQPQTEDDQNLEEEVASGPHIWQKQADLLPETLPSRLVLVCCTEQALR